MMNENLMNLEAYEAFKRSLNIFNDFDDFEPVDLDLDYYIEPFDASTRYGLIKVDFIYDSNDNFITAVIERGERYLKVNDNNNGVELYNGLKALRFNDAYIQNELPSLTPVEREFIMTGIIF